MEMDELDQLAARAFEGFVVRKDLALRFKVLFYADGRDALLKALGD